MPSQLEPPIFGTVLLEVSIGRDSGALKGKKRRYSHTRFSKRATAIGALVTSKAEQYITSPKK